MRSVSNCDLTGANPIVISSDHDGDNACEYFIEFDGGQYDFISLEKNARDKVVLKISGGWEFSEIVTAFVNLSKCFPDLIIDAEENP